MIAAAIHYPDTGVGEQGISVHVNGKMKRLAAFSSYKDGSVQWAQDGSWFTFIAVGAEQQEKFVRVGTKNELVISISDVQR